MGLGSGIRKKPIPDPGSRGQKGTGSRIRIRNTEMKGWTDFFGETSKGFVRLFRETNKGLVRLFWETITGWSDYLRRKIGVGQII
jgi:hypothetical protein